MTGDSLDGEFYALVLAAGAGSRFGGDKLRARWGEGRLIDAALATASAAPVAGVLLLVKPGDRLIEDAGVRVIEVADWAEGMAESLKAGIAALPIGCAGAFVFLGDMPRIPRSILPKLAEAVRGGAAAAAPEFEGALGHPVLVSAALFPALLTLEGDRGARRVLEGLGERLIRIPAPDDGVLFDVDHPADLDREQPSGVPPRSEG